MLPSKVVSASQVLLRRGGVWWRKCSKLDFKDRGTPGTSIIELQSVKYFTRATFHDPDLTKQKMISYPGLGQYQKRQPVKWIASDDEWFRKNFHTCLYGVGWMTCIHFYVGAGHFKVNYEFKWLRNAHRFIWIMFGLRRAIERRVYLSMSLYL